MAYSTAQSSRSSVEGRTTASMAALQKRLDSLQADQLEAFQAREEAKLDPRNQTVGLVTGGLMPKGFDEYRTNLNNQGEIARTKSILAGGSGELSIRSGGSAVENPSEPPSNPAPESVKGLGRAAFDPGDINDPSGKMKLAVYNKRMADLEAGTAQAEAARRRAVVSTDPRAGYIEDQAGTAAEIEDARAKAAFGREQIGPNMEAQLGAERDRWNDPTQERMRQRQERMLIAPTAERGDAARDVANIKAGSAETVAGTASQGRQNVALIQQAAANLRNATDNYNPGDPASIQRYKDALDEVNRLKTPAARTAGPDAPNPAYQAFADRNVPIS